MSEQVEMTRKAMARAIRRINILKFLILAVAGALAVFGGAVAAWVLNATLEAPFGLSWVVASILFFGVPGALVYGREVRAARGRESRTGAEEEGSADGR